MKNKLLKSTNLLNISNQTQEQTKQGIDNSDDLVNLKLNFVNSETCSSVLTLHRKYAIQTLDKLNSIFCRTILIGRKDGIMDFINKKYLSSASIEEIPK